MKIIVNSKEQVIEKDSLTVAELLAVSGVENPALVTVQRNGEFVGKDAYADVSLNEGDAIDFLYFMGGGGLS